MALNASVINIAAGLQNTLLTTPQIGTSQVSASLGFTDGDVAEDVYVNVGTSSTPLNTALGSGNGYILVTNPSTTTAVNLLVGSTPLGPLPAAPATGTPTPAVFPIASGVVINATVSAGTVNVGVTIIKVSANS